MIFLSGYLPPWVAGPFTSGSVAQVASITCEGNLTRSALDDRGDGR